MFFKFSFPLIISIDSIPYLNRYYQVCRMNHFIVLLYRFPQKEADEYGKRRIEGTL